MKQSNRLVIILFSLVAVLFVTVFYLLYIINIPKPLPPIYEEVLGIQINTCCSCPTRISSSLIGTDGWVIYEKGKNYSQFLPEKCKPTVCQPCPPLEEELSSLPDSDLRRGWYWGTEDQKQLGTPDTWVFTEAGRGSCWHDPNNDCSFSPSEAAY
ncbi:MAG: hypothetical protein AAB574_00495 [Patescibacteria group bacterium]